jgi:hypothetical protein
VLTEAGNVGVSVVFLTPFVHALTAKDVDSTHLLKLAVPLVKTHGFTRDALARSVLALPTPHTEPLPDTAVDALFGRGDDARRTLINAWLDDGVQQMKAVSSPTMNSILRFRLERNEPVLQHLPEVSNWFVLLRTLIIPYSRPLPCLSLQRRASHRSTFCRR